MHNTELISTLQTYLNTNIAAPVHVGGTNERPVPAITLENWSVTQIDLANSNYIGTDTDDVTGFDEAKVYRIPYDCRVSFKIRHDDTVEASKLRDQLRLELGRLEDRPSLMGDSLSQVSIGRGGEVSYQFAEPTETEMTQAATFTAATMYKDGDFDNIEDIDVEVSVI